MTFPIDTFLESVVFDEPVTWEGVLPYAEDDPDDIDEGDVPGPDLKSELFFMQELLKSLVPAGGFVVYREINPGRLSSLKAGDTFVSKNTVVASTDAAMLQTHDTGLMEICVDEFPAIDKSRPQESNVFLAAGSVFKVVDSTINAAGRRVVRVKWDGQQT